MVAKASIIIGGGGHSHVLIGLMQAAALPLRGIITSNPELVGTTVLGVPVLGLEGEVELSVAEVMLMNGVGNHASSKGTGIAPRATLFDRYCAQGFEFLTCVSPDAMVQPHVSLQHGAQVMAGVVIQPNARIGENAIINTRASVDHDCVVESHCHIAPGAVLCGHVQVGRATHIGAGAVILQNVRVGSNVVIGAGCVVSRDVPDGAVIRRGGN